MSSHWNGVADTYEMSFGTLCSGTVDRMLRDTSSTSGDARHLDLGCGTGELAVAAMSQGRVMTLVDSDPSMVTRARQRCAQVCEASALDLPLQSGSFDVVTANFLINHLSDPRQGVAEIARVLRAAGCAAMTIWPTGSLAWAKLVGAAFEAAKVVPLPDQRLPSHRDFDRSVDGLSEITRDAGMRVTTAKELTWYWTVTPSNLWRGVSGGVGAAGRTFLAQSHEVQRRAEQEFFARAEDLINDGTLSFPMTAAYVVAGHQG